MFSRLNPTVRRTILRGVFLVVIIYMGLGIFSTGAGKVNDIKDAAELAMKIATGSPILVDFTASWCGPCKMMAPELEAVAAANTKVTFFKVDIDKHKDIAEKHRVTSVPAVFFFNKGKQTGKFSGSHDRTFIQNFLLESQAE